MNKIKVGSLIGIATLGSAILAVCGFKGYKQYNESNFKQMQPKSKYEASARGQVNYDQQFSGIVTNSSDSRIFVDITGGLSRKANVLKVGKVVLLTDKTTIKDESNARLKPSDLKKGDAIEFVLVDNPMVLRSMPPQITGSSIVKIVKV